MIYMTTHLKLLLVTGVAVNNSKLNFIVRGPCAAQDDNNPDSYMMYIRINIQYTYTYFNHTNNYYNITVYYIATTSRSVSVGIAPSTSRVMFCLLYIAI